MLEEFVEENQNFLQFPFTSYNALCSCISALQTWTMQAKFSKIFDIMEQENLYWHGQRED